MPNRIDYYMVRMVNLITGQFAEKEMSDIELDTFNLANEIGGEKYQIINKEFLRTKRLTF